MEELIRRILRSLTANRLEETTQASLNFTATNLAVFADLDGMAAAYLKALDRYYLRAGGPPMTGTIKQDALRLGQMELAVYTDEVAVAAWSWGANYQALLDQYKEERGRVELRRALQTSARVLDEGVKEQGKSEMRGMLDASDYLLSAITEIKGWAEPHRQAMSNRDAAATISREYAERRSKPALAYGATMGINTIDSATHGAKPGELWLLAGFASHGKSTWMLNWAHFLAMRSGHPFNILIYSLEMSKKQVWQILTCIHSSHEKWRGRPALNYMDLKRGTLSLEDETFLQQKLLPDLQSSFYGRIEVYTPSGVTRLSNIWAQAEVLNRTLPLDMVMVDYLEMLSPEEKFRGDRFQAINVSIAGAKQMAQQFNRGQGIAVVSPHQINRQGLQRAQERGGIYDVAALADASEAERSSDNVFALYKDQAMEQRNVGLVTHLKNRDGPVVGSFEVAHHAANRWIGNLPRGQDYTKLLQNY